MTNAVKTIHKGRAVSATLLRGLSVGAASILVTTGLMLTFAPPVSASTTVPAGAVVVSNHTGSDSVTGCSSAAYTTIQAGVNAASSGATIYVCAGTYTENVTIDEPLTLDGAEFGQGVQTRAGGESVVSSVSIGTSNVSVDGFSFNGRTSQVSVNSPTTLSGLVIQNNIFNGYGGVGLPTYDAGNITVQKNLFENALASSEAIQIKAATVTGGCNDSQVLDNVFSAATNNGGADVNFSCTNSNSIGATVSGNVSSGDTTGSSFVAFSGVDGGISVTNNTATTTGSTVFFFGNVSGTAVIEGNAFTGGGGNAISIHVGSDVGTSDAVNTGTFTITSNTLTGNLRGVYVSAGALATAASVVIHFNDLSGNSTAGVENDSSVTTVNAIDNWWGSASGPQNATNLNGTASPVTANVNVLPELTAPPVATLDVATDGTDAGNCEVGACATIGYALSQAPVGGTIDVGPGTFDESQLVIWNPVTIVGDGASETTIDVNSANLACQGEAEYFFIQYPVTAVGPSGFCSEPRYDGTSPAQSGAYAINDVTLEGIGGAPTPDLRDYEGLPDNPDLIVSNIPAASTFELNGDTLYASRSIDPNIEGDGSVGAILGGDPNSSTSVTDTTFNGMWQAILAYGYSGSLSVTDSTFENLVPLNMDEAFVLASGLPWTPPPGTSTETFAPEGLLSMNPGSDGGQTGTGMFSVKGSTFTGYDGDGVIAEAGEGYVNRPGGVDGAVIENNTFDLGVASDTLTGTTQPIVIDADQGSTTTSVLISGNSVTTNGIGAEAIALTTASDPSSPGQITTVTIKNNSLTATGAGAIDVALAGISGSGTEGTISDVSLTGNDLLGSGSGIDVNGPTIASVSAIGNYWGDPSGPSGQGPGSGRSVPADIAYANWCTTVTCPSSPSSPLSPSATAGSSPDSATVTWSEPVTDGGRALTGFVVTPFDSNTGQAGSSIPFGPTATSAALTGLTGGDSYTFAVAASNGVATGPSTSSNSVAVVPSVVPTVAPPPTGISSSDLGTPVSGVAANSVTTTVALKLSTGTGAPTATSSIVIPAGALPAGTVVSAYPITNTAPLVAQVPAGQSYVVSLAVTWEALDGSSPTATAPITLTITDAGIVAGDTVYEVTSSGLIVVGTASANGVVSITFTNDPTFVVAAALVSQSPISITSLNGEPGTALSLVTSGGQGTGAVSFTVTNGTAIGCAISGTSLSASSAGTCVVTVTKAADATYLSASSTASVTFRKAKVVPSASPPVARASQMSVVFAFYSSALSNSTRSALIDLSRKLARGASVTIVGYADFDIPLATSRAVAVKKFLQRLVPIKVKIKIVTNLPARKVDVINTAT